MKKKKKVRAVQGEGKKRGPLTGGNRRCPFTGKINPTRVKVIQKKAEIGGGFL